MSHPRIRFSVQSCPVSSFLFRSVQPQFTKKENTFARVDRRGSNDFRAFHTPNTVRYEQHTCGEEAEKEC